MNYFLSISFLLFLALLFLAGTVLLMNIRTKLKYVFATYIFFTALTLLFRVYASLPSEQITGGGLWFWYSFSSFVNSLLPFMTIHLILVLSEKGRKYNKPLLGITFIISLILGLVTLQKGALANGFRLGDAGYMQVRSVSIWVTIYSTYYTVALIVVIALCFEWYRAAKSELEHKQAQFMLWGNTIIFVFAFIIYGYIGGKSIKNNHLLATLLQTLILGIYGYAIFRYRLLGDSRGIAAKNVIRNMSQVFILTDNKDDAIVSVNGATVKLLGYPEAELLRMKIKDIFYVVSDIPGVVAGTFATVGAEGKSAGQYEGHLRTSRGGRIPVEFNISEVSVEKIGFKGSVIVANDVSEMLDYVERQKYVNTKMKATYAELKKKKDFMTRFQNIVGEREERKQKLRLELEKIKAENA